MGKWMAANCGGCLSLPSCSVHACNRGCEPRAQQPSPEDGLLSPAWEGGCLSLAGSQPGSLGLTAHHWQRLSISCPTVLLRLKWAMCQPRLVSRGWESQQDSPGRDSCQNGRRTLDTAPPAPYHTGWDGNRGTMALFLQLPKPL